MKCLALPPRRRRLREDALKQPPAMRLPRFVLLPLWAVLTLLAYYLVLCTPWTAYAPAGGPLRTVLTQACVVLAVACCVEVLRSEERIQLRALAGAVGFPLALVLLLTLWIGLRRYFGV